MMSYVPTVLCAQSGQWCMWVIVSREEPPNLPFVRLSQAHRCFRLETNRYNLGGVLQDERDGSTVMSSCCFSRGLDSGSQHPCQVAHNTCNSSSMGSGAHFWPLWAFAHKCNTHRHTNNFLRESDLFGSFKHILNTNTLWLQKLHS